MASRHTDRLRAPDNSMTIEIEANILIAGAGPSGTALASFLGQNGLRGLLIAKDASTAYTPGAHGLNPFSLECLRDIDLEDEALRLAIRGPRALSMRFSRSIIGDEFGRIQAWGEKPDAMAKVRKTTPSEYVDLPQRFLEPLLARFASHHGFNVRFSTEPTSVEKTADGEIRCTVYDLITKQSFIIMTKWLIGADGARSVVARSLSFKFISKPGGIQACNVLFRADLSNHKEERQTALSWVVNPEHKTFPGLVGHLRVVRPWNEWVMAAFGPGGSNPFDGLTLNDPRIIACIREMVGDESIDVELLAMDPWTVREVIAEDYKRPDMNAFILGDAAHRHPPTYGL
ncbi:hypothetical protein B9Z65_5554 [Elsinoe australis]|uniref:FAD-binding domain-containing protein n=1 Tax=Elsinoe australis TaxID=40998 RepID=A0A2P7ZEE6_9PEZI|nr:hypothetical protein B9Z65_5554 [Elsinoe australis]